MAVSERVSVCMWGGVRFTALVLAVVVVGPPMTPTAMFTGSDVSDATILHCAALHGHVDVVRTVLADLSAARAVAMSLHIDSSGQTAAALAGARQQLTQGHRQTYAALLAINAPSDDVPMGMDGEADRSGGSVPDHRATTSNWDL